MTAPDECGHEITDTIKRAVESHEAPEWENAIIEHCRDCGGYIVT